MLYVCVLFLLNRTADGNRRSCASSMVWWMICWSFLQVWSQQSSSLMNHVHLIQVRGNLWVMAWACFLAVFIRMEHCFCLCISGWIMVIALSGLWKMLIDCVCAHVHRRWGPHSLEGFEGRVFCSSPGSRRTDRHTGGAYGRAPQKTTKAGSSAGSPGEKSTRIYFFVSPFIIELFVSFSFTRFSLKWFCYRNNTGILFHISANLSSALHKNLSRNVIDLLNVLSFRKRNARNKKELHCRQSRELR